MEKLSITDADQEISLKATKADSIAESVKVGIKAVGIVADNLLGIPPIGTIIAELITTTIPSRRMENVVLMLEILGDKVKYIDKDVLELKMKTKEFEDLIQDGFIQASRALSKERLEYIASLLKNSLTDEELGHLEKKKLLGLLGELNDIEIIWLKSYCFSMRSFQDPEFKDFYEKHEKVLEEIALTHSSSDVEMNKNSLQQSYKNNLLRLDLLSEKFNRVKIEGVLPKFDEKTGKLPVSGYHCNRLGKMLLKYIDLETSEEN